MKKQPVDVFIIPKGGPVRVFGSLLNEIENLNGKIRHAFPPLVIIASLTPENIDELRKSVSVGYLTTDEIVEPPALLSGDESREFVSFWNKKVRISREPGSRAPADEDLSWDAPGYLPPDPPPHIRTMMDKWERDAGNSGEGR